MRKHLATILTTVLMGATQISAADTNTDAIEARQAAFKTIKQSMAELKDALSSANYGAAADPARKVLDNARAVTTLFPAGSGTGDTRAKEKIWENFDDFSERQQKLVADAEALVTAADSKDPQQLKAAFKQTATNCKGCHSKYRKLW